MRILGVDLARGLALLAVFVAHTAPIGPSSPIPERLLMGADNVAAPLFTLLFGVSAGLAARSAEQAGQSRGQFRLFFELRALVLIGFGVLADLGQHSVIPILHYLGAVGLVLIPVLYLRARWLLVMSVGAVVVSAIAMPWAQALQMTLRVQAVQGGGSGWAENTVASLVGFVFSDFGYRVSGLLAFALAGLAVGRIALQSWGRLMTLFLVGGALTAGALGVGQLTGISTDAYAGTAPELVNAIGLAGMVLAASCALSATPLRRVLAPVYALGTLTLTFYVAHIVVLGAWASLTGLSDDKWSVLLALSVGSLAGAWLIRRRWRRGPAEWLVHQVAQFPLARRRGTRRATATAGPERLR